MRGAVRVGDGGIGNGDAGRGREREGVAARGDDDGERGREGGVRRVGGARESRTRSVVAVIRRESAIRAR